MSNEKRLHLFTHDRGGRSIRFFVLSVVASIFASLATTASADDYLWFERSWISDAHETFAANPALEKLPDNVREKYRSLFGKMRWRVSGGILTVEPPDAPAFSRPYFIRSIDENSFELMMDDGETETVRRRGQGFCIETEIQLHDETLAPYVLECFAPHDA